MRKGSYHTKETIQKMKDMHTGENNSNYGKHHSFSNEAKQRMSEAHKGIFSGNKHPQWKGGIKLRWKRANDKRKNDLEYQLNSRITRSINSSLKKGIKNHRLWCDLINYNVEQLKKRLEFTMPKGYTWQDFLNGNLHIDHIIPISAFNFLSSEHLDFRRCWALNNLQLLPAKENMSKGAKLITPFQPSLRI